MIEINDKEFGLFREYLLDSCGIDIPEEKRYLFNTRLGPILEKKNCTGFGGLYDLLQDNSQPELRNQVVEAMTTNETAFFRDGHPFEAFGNVILPELAARKQKESLFFPPGLRIWSAACSTGQEPYSIAMILYEFMKRQNSFNADNIRIFATDISAQAVKKAETGEYTDAEIDKGMKEVYRGLYAEKSGGKWHITDKIRKMVNFRQLNLARDFFPDMANLDLIFCRNVIIYFSVDLREKIVEKFYRVLNPGGILMIGAAENLYGITSRFEVVHIGATTIYRAKEK